MSRQNTCVRQKDLSKQKIIKTYCYNVFKEMFTFLFSLIFFFFYDIKQIYLCNAHYEQPLSFVAFFTKRNDREKIKT